MAVTILERPQGQVLSTAGIQAKIDDAYGSPDATVYSVGHGLSDGAFVYIVSNIDDYNGFFYVDSTGANTFKIKQYSAGDYVQFVQDANITYYVSQSTHGWSAVHLPITYRLSSDLFPTNTVDTVRNINSVVDEDGSVLVNISGSLGTIHSYDSVKITLPNDTEYSGVYSIVEWISNTVMVLDLAYDSTINFSGATIQKYYNNYNILVRVYAGISSGHEWAAKKPMGLATTLQLIPDENGEVFFSVNEVLKSYIETRNNPNIGTQPNNIDFWNNFYIEYGESYDDADGYSLGTFTSSYTSDESNFVGYSVNAKLEFKNLQSGYMSDYMNSKFLTLFAIPVLFSCSDEHPNCYQDISFINGYSSTIVLHLTEQYYLNDILQSTVVTDIDSEGEGLYRIPLSDANCANDRVDVTIFADLEAAEESTFGQISGNQTLTYNGSSSVGPALRATGMIPGALSNIGYVKFQAPAGTYNIGGTTNVTILSGSGTYRVRYFILDYNLNILDTSADYAVTSPTPDTNTEDLTSTDQISYIGLQFIFVSGSGSITMDGSIFARTAGAVVGTEVEDILISETKQFKIDCGCSAQELRLTWLNNLGGFDYWKFTAEKDLLVEIRETGETRKNIFPTWPKSYGANSDTIRKQTFRDSNKGYTIRSQFVTEDEIDALAFIKSSVLVQIINSRQDRRTVIVDADSFIIRADGDKTHSISFNVSFTDDIPSQSA